MPIHDLIKLTTFGVELGLKHNIWDSPRLLAILDTLGAKRGQSLRWSGNSGSGIAWQPSDDNRYEYNYVKGCANLATLRKVVVQKSTFWALAKGDPFFVDGVICTASANFFIKSGPKRGGVENLTGCWLKYTHITFPPDKPVWYIANYKPQVYNVE